MSKARREKKKAGKAASAPSKAVKGTEKKPRAMSVERLEQVFGKGHESVDEFVQAVENDLRQQHLADVDENDLKNAELRWLRHFSATRKSIAADDMESAVQELQFALKFAERLNDYRLANTYGELGFVSMRLKEFDTARAFFRKALTVREALYGAEHPSVAIEYSNLAMSYQWQREFAKARPLLEAAVSILDKHGQWEALNQAEPYEALSAIYKSKKEFVRAEELCRKALEIRDQLAGHLHPISIKTVELLIQIREAAGKPRKVAEARKDYDSRLQEYADSKSFGAAAKMLKHLLEHKTTGIENEAADASISDFLRLVARR
ncbi:MAG TPA: tetratricopeptide repeat protein [Planktothrix sp.]|jgi:tetratricopeptide (TPR) repeat protein